MCFGSKGAGGGPSTGAVGGAALAGTAMGGPLVGAAIGVVGGVMQVLGGLKEGKAQKENLYQRAALKERQALDTQESALENLRDMGRQARSDVSSSKVAGAKAGVRVGGGSPVRVRDRIQREYARNAGRYGKDVANQMENLRIEASLLRKEGKQAVKASRIGALSAGLGTAKQMAPAGSFLWKEYFGSKKPEGVV